MLNIDKDRPLSARVAALRSQYPTAVEIDLVLDPPYSTKSWSGVFTTGVFQFLVRHHVGDDFRTAQAHGTSKLQMPSALAGQGDTPIVLRDERPLTPRHKRLSAGLFAITRSHVRSGSVSVKEITTCCLE